MDGVCDAFYRIEGGIFFLQREGRFLSRAFLFFFLLRVENVLTYGELSVGSLHVRLGCFFFLFRFFLNVDGALKSRQICSFAAHACALHLQQREHTRERRRLLEAA